MKRETYTLFDRVAVALLYAALAFFTSGIVLVGLYLAFGYSQVVWEVGSIAVWGFTLLMALLGFLLLHNVIASIFGRLWKWIINGMGGTH
jgi:hypothetical protein